MNREINILLSSDDNYSQHLGVCIYSILANNGVFDSINIFVANNHITEENINKINQIVSQFNNASVCWIDFSSFEKQLNLDMEWEISISSYSRLFVASMLPESVDRVLYMDCDMIVKKPLDELWNYELGSSILGAVQDAMKPEMKNAVGLEKDDLYFNAGLLLIDLKKWRENNVGKRCMDFISDHKGKVIHHDQGILNGVLKNEWVRLPIKYNLMTIYYEFSNKKITKYFRDTALSYSENEIEYAKRTPVIIHYTPSFTTRPWVKKCKHPLKRFYWEYLQETPWKNQRPEDDKTKWYVKLINWRYLNLPY